MHNHVGGMACSETCPAYAIVETGEPEDFTDFKAPEYAANMTLRDHFAGLAMAAVLGLPVPEARNNPGACAVFSYEQADAMMFAREVKRG